MTSKLRCKDYYNLFQESKTTEPTAVKRWSTFYPGFATSWYQTFSTDYRSTKAQTLHRILVTNKELKKFKIRNDDICSLCKNPDSLERTLFECPTDF